jgi:glutamate-ammonia-ligase adenylyltransferase
LSGFKVLRGTSTRRFFGNATATFLANSRSDFAESAETWEFLALSRARLVWASSPGFAARCRDAIEAALRRPRAPDATLRDVAQMRALMRLERPAKGFWDLKLADGGLVDVEFAAQTLQILGASRGGRLTPSTVAALTAAAEEGRISGADATVLIDSWRLHQAVAQMLRLALRKDCQPEDEPAGFQALVAQAVGVGTLADLRTRLEIARCKAREVCSRIAGAV